MIVASLMMMTTIASCAETPLPLPDTESGSPPPMAVVNARIWTGDTSLPRAEALATRSGRVTAIGSNTEIEKSLIAAAANSEDAYEVVDAGGAILVPGFIDSHTHFIFGGFNLSSVQLRDAASPQEFARRIAAFAQTMAPDTWILGGDWDHELWGGALPHRDWIDVLTPDTPVWVSRLDGHMGVANSAALAAAGIDRNTPDVDGGTIVRHYDGEPTGVLKDNAMALIEAAIPSPPPELTDRAVGAAMRHAVERGVTSVHDMGTWSDLEAFRRYARNNPEPDTRIHSCVPLPTWERLRDEIAANGSGDEWVRIGCLKAMVDGSLGSHTTAFFEPFTDAPENTGLLVNSPADLLEWTAAADAVGLQVNVHAIGDRAIDTQLSIFERVALNNGERDRRFRIEHAQHPRGDDIARFARLSVIPSMQPYHAIDDGRWAERVIGRERVRTSYAFRTMLDVGARLVLGSDWSVAPLDPIQGIYAATTRRTIDGANPDGWVPEQRIGVEEALRAYTIDAAYAAFEEGTKGSLETGKVADFVILDRDLTVVEPTEFGDVRVLATIVGGKIRFADADWTSRRR